MSVITDRWRALSAATDKTVLRPDLLRQDLRRCFDRVPWWEPERGGAQGGARFTVIINRADGQKLGLEASLNE